MKVQKKVMATSINIEIAEQFQQYLDSTKYKKGQTVENLIKYFLECDVEEKIKIFHSVSYTPKERSFIGVSINIEVIKMFDDYLKNSPFNKGGTLDALISYFLNSDNDLKNKMLKIS